MKLANKKIVLGITGGIAAYKIPSLVRLLKSEGADVYVVMTESAKAFISPLTLEAISEHVVYSDLLTSDSGTIIHIKLAQMADALVIAPATANTIAKIANGIADNLLTSIVLATKAKLFIAPAMNVNMYNNIATAKNLKTLKEYNWQFLGPECGSLACGITGKGKMSSPEELCKYICASFTKEDANSSQSNEKPLVKQDLLGKKVIITAGPTQEPIDPVRFITNKSSGKMGYALANEAQKRGANVFLISGQVNIEAPNNINLIKVDTAEQMLEAVTETLPSADIFIGCAAVADYRVKEVNATKIKKENTDSLTIELIKNPDILQTVGHHISRPPLVIGFAAETNDLELNALKKLEKKNADYIILNDVSNSDIGFNSDYNKVTILGKNGDKIELEKSPKSEIAEKIFTICTKGITN